MPDAENADELTTTDESTSEERSEDSSEGSSEGSGEEGSSPEGAIRPDGLPEGFDTLADYVAHVTQEAANHKELRKKMSQEGAPKKKAKEKIEAEAGAEKDEKAEGVEEDSDEPTITEEQRDRMASEIGEHGALSPESMSELVALGFNEQYIQEQSGLAAVAVIRERAIYASCGDNATDGEERFNVAARWAQQSMDEAELDATQKLLESPDVSVAKRAAASLVAKCQADTPPLLMNSETSFRSDDRLIKDAGDIPDAVSDPRYLKDPEYTRKVQEGIRKVS